MPKSDEPTATQLADVERVAELIRAPSGPPSRPEPRPGGLRAAVARVLRGGR